MKSVEQDFSINFYQNAVPFTGLSAGNSGETPDLWKNDMKYRVSHNNFTDFISHGPGKHQTKFAHGLNPDRGLTFEWSWSIFNPLHSILVAVGFFVCLGFFVLLMCWGCFCKQAQTKLKRSYLSSSYDKSADFQILSIHQHTWKSEYFFCAVNCEMKFWTF